MFYLNMRGIVGGGYLQSVTGPSPASHKVLVDVFDISIPDSGMSTPVYETKA